MVDVDVVLVVVGVGVEVELSESDSGCNALPQTLLHPFRSSVWVRTMHAVSCQ